MSDTERDELADIFMDGVAHEVPKEAKQKPRDVVSIRGATD